MSQIQCDAFLYAGKWTPRTARSLREVVNHALYGMVKFRGQLRLLSVELETLPAGDGPGVVAHICVDSCSDPEALCECVNEALLYHLRPEYESQLEVEIADMAADLSDCPSGGDDDVADTYREMT